MNFWRLLTIGGGLTGVAVIVLALFAAGQSGTPSAATSTPTVAVPAAPVEQTRRPKFNVN